MSELVKAGETTRDEQREETETVTFEIDPNDFLAVYDDNGFVCIEYQAREVR